MKWLILAICAEISVLLCLIFAFDGALHDAASRRLTWDHAVVFVIYSMVRIGFSWKRIADMVPVPARVSATNPRSRAA